jgi:hypothetical protein
VETDGDTLKGGEGIDTAFYLTSDQGVLVNLQKVRLWWRAQGDTFESIEKLEGSLHDDTLVAMLRTIPLVD